MLLGVLGVGGGECLWGLVGRLVGVPGLECGLLMEFSARSGWFLGGQGGRFDLALRVVGGVWSACGVGGAWWGLVAVLWAGAEECGGDGAGAGIIC